MIYLFFALSRVITISSKCLFLVGVQYKKYYKKNIIKFNRVYDLDRRGIKIDSIYHCLNIKKKIVILKFLKQVKSCFY